MTTRRSFLSILASAVASIPFVGKFAKTAKPLEGYHEISANGILVGPKQKASEPIANTFDTTECPRCGRNHLKVHAIRFCNPIEIPFVDNQLSHYAICPTTGEPMVFLAAEAISRGWEVGNEQKQQTHATT